MATFLGTNAVVVTRVHSTIFEPAHEKRELVVFRFVILQMHMSSPLVRLLTCKFVWSFLKVTTTCLRTAKAFPRLRFRAGSPELLLVAYVISILFSCADTFSVFLYLFSSVALNPKNIENEANKCTQEFIQLDPHQAPDTSVSRCSEGISRTLHPYQTHTNHYDSQKTGLSCLARDACRRNIKSVINLSFACCIIVLWRHNRCLYFWATPIKAILKYIWSIFLSFHLIVIEYVHHYALCIEICLVYKSSTLHQH